LLKKTCLADFSKEPDRKIILALRLLACGKTSLQILKSTEKEDKN